MSFEELIKKYEPFMAVPMYPKALVIDFMEKAYEAGLHADVHTDNSAVIAELEKENAELKEKLKPENCLKLLAKEGYIKFTSDQLTKAKEIIKNLLSAYTTYADSFDDRDNEIVAEAEQFLNSEVEK